MAASFLLLGAYDPIPLAIGTVVGVVGFVLGVKLRQTMPNETSAPGFLAVVGFVLGAVFAYMVLMAAFVGLLVYVIGFAVYHSRGYLQELFEQRTAALRMKAEARFSSRKRQLELQRAHREHQDRRADILQADVPPQNKQRLLDDADAAYQNQLIQINKS